MVLFTCTALRFKQPTTISFASLSSLSRERRRQKKLSPGKKATQNRLDWVLGTTRFARGFSFFERAKRASRDFSLVVSLRGRARGVGFLPFAPPALVAPVEIRELRESLSFELSLMPRQQKEHHPQSVLFKACDSCFSTPRKKIPTRVFLILILFRPKQHTRRIPGVRGGILDEAKRPSVERVPEDPRFRNERVRALEPTRSVYQVAILRRLRAQ